jgi:transcriptional regulator with XRE-family HTH domain
MQAGLSQKGLADKAGLALSAIGHLEQGLRKPTWETVLALANALGVSCEAFTTPASTDEPAPRGRPRKCLDVRQTCQEPTRGQEKGRPGDSRHPASLVET